MPLPELPFEIWAKILGYVRNPIPETRANVPRSDILQTSLCMALRTCKLFQTICEPLLYRYVATDRVQEFLPGHASEVSSRRRLLAHTEELYFEYCDKYPEVSYLTLMGDKSKVALWELFGKSEEFRRHVNLALCVSEIESLNAGLGVMEQAGPTSELFPRLRILCVGAICGGQDEDWWRYDYKCGGYPAEKRYANPRETSDLFYRFCQSSTLRHLCLRGQYGPLMMPRTTFASSPPPTSDYTWTQHFVRGGDSLSIPFGRSARWVSDAPSNTNWSSFGETLPRIFLSAMEDRAAAGARGVDGGAAALVDIQMYCSIAMPEDTFDAGTFPPASTTSSSPPFPLVLNTKQRNIIFGNGASLQKNLRRKQGLQDTFRWFPSSEAKECPGCRSLPPP